jgi:hypothetical protein
MKTRPLVALLLAAFLTLPAHATAADEAPPPAPARQSPEPAVREVVIEDEGSRIEELRVRGETQRVSVTAKGPFFKSTYDIVTPRQGRQGDLAGQRVWSVFKF